jgi:hypothetical protein
VGRGKEDGLTNTSLTKDMGQMVPSVLVGFVSIEDMIGFGRRR